MPVSFVPMSSIDEMRGRIISPETRLFGEVSKGYAPFRDDDVLFAKITPCMQNGKAAIARSLVGGLGFGSTEFHVLRAMEQVLPEWLFAFVRQPHFRAMAEASFTGSAGQQRVPAAFMEEAEIPVPPLAEQRRIVAILDEAESLRALRRPADRRTADLIPAIFHDMFGDPATNPMGWPMREVQSIAQVQSGLTLGQRRNSYTLRRPYLRVANVQRGYLLLDKVKEIGLTAEEEAKTKLHPADLLLVEGNGNPQEIGRAALWDGSVAHCVHQNHLIRLRCSQTIVKPEFLLHFINSESGRAYFLGVGNTTSGLVTLNTTRVKQCCVPIPPLPLQKQFAAAVREIRAMQAKQSASRRRLDDLFHSLLHRAFRGEL